MDGKNKIIQRIIADAEARCKAIIANAEKEANAIVDNVNAKFANDKLALEDKIATNDVAIVANAMSNAQLDIRKYALQQKQNLIDAVYNKALQQLMSLSDKQYVELIAKLLSAYAEDGEIVMISKSDNKRITQQVLDKTGKKLTLSTQHADIEGGVVLSGVGYDKVLTLSMLISQARDNTDSAVAKALFEVK